MSRWRNKAIINLLKNSKENKDHAIAAKEWEFTGKVVDHLTSDNLCQLCEGENLRYHFEIKNIIKQESSLLVGSSCIRKIDITVYDESGKEISGNKKSSFLQYKIDQKKRELMLDEVRSLWKVSTREERELIEDFIDEYKIKNGFNPDHLNKLFYLMEKYEMAFNAALFKVSLRSQFELNCLLTMSEPEINFILPCLSVAQKKRYAEKKKQIKTNRNSKPRTLNRNILQLQSSKRQRSPKKESKPFLFPDYVTCSICGEHKRWVTLNPNKCKECLETSHTEY